MNQRSSRYVGARMWRVLNLVAAKAPASLPLGVLRREAYALDPTAKGQLVIGALLAREMLEWTCPQHQAHPSPTCRLRITERGYAARLDKRGRKTA